MLLLNRRLIYLTYSCNWCCIHKEGSCELLLNMYPAYLHFNIKFESYIKIDIGNPKLTVNIFLFRTFNNELLKIYVRNKLSTKIIKNVTYGTILPFYKFTKLYYKKIYNLHDS